MKRRVVAIVFTLLFAGALAAAWYALGLFRQTPSLGTTNDVPSVMTLVAAMNVRQGPNQCGPYAAAMAVAALGGDTSPTDMVRDLPWKLPGGYTHPHALESLLGGKGFSVDSYDAGSLSDEEKIRFLQQELATQSPVILLTYMYSYQHYVTLLGYDDDGFFVYDPVYTRGDNGMTADDNGSAPGNRTIRQDDLLSDWSEGGIMGMYTWYALVVKN